MSNIAKCPYCETQALTPVGPGTATRPRHPQHEVVQCDNCSGYAVRLVRGRVVPLADRTDPNADAILKVVDTV